MFTNNPYTLSSLETCTENVSFINPKPKKLNPLIRNTCLQKVNFIRKKKAVTYKSKYLSETYTQLITLFIKQAPKSDRTWSKILRETIFLQWRLLLKQTSEQTEAPKYNIKYKCLDWNWYLKSVFGYSRNTNTYIFC